jgi:hypothetical protein
VELLKKITHHLLFILRVVGARTCFGICEKLMDQGGQEGIQIIGCEFGDVLAQCSTSNTQEYPLLRGHFEGNKENL